MATYQQSFDPKGANLFNTNIPELALANGTNIPVSGVAFDAAAIEAIFVELKALAYLSGNVTVKLFWYGSATTNAVVWGAQLAALTAGDAQSLLTDALATAATTTTTVNGTANGPNETTVTITSLDSLAAGDMVQLRIFRDATNGADTYTVDAILVDIEVSYAATGGVGAGDVTGPGSATDNAIARYDSTTGKVIQGSDLLVDDSENITGAGTYNGVVVDKHQVAAELSGTVALTTGTTLQNVTGLAVSLPRAGTYLIEAYLPCTATATLTSAFAINVSANLTRMNLCCTNHLTASTYTTEQQNGNLSSGGTGIASGSRSITTVRGVIIQGTVVVSGAATLQLLASRSTSTLTFATGCVLSAKEL